jgi:hypothetical protein
MSVKISAGFNLFSIRLRGQLLWTTEDTSCEIKDGFLDLLLTNQFLKDSTSWVSVWVWVGGWVREWLSTSENLRIRQLNNLTACVATVVRYRQVKNAVPEIVRCGLHFLYIRRHAVAVHSNSPRHLPRPSQLLKITLFMVPCIVSLY